MPDKSAIRAARDISAITDEIVAAHAGLDRDIACRALAAAIGILIKRDPTLFAQRILAADLYGLHIKAVARRAYAANKIEGDADHGQ